MGAVVATGRLYGLVAGLVWTPLHPGGIFIGEPAPPYQEWGSGERQIDRFNHLSCDHGISA